MKKMQKLLALMGMASVLVFSACKKEEEDPAPAVTPDATAQIDDNNTSREDIVNVVIGKSTYNLKLSVLSASSSLQRMLVTKSTDGAAATVLNITDLESDIINETNYEKIPNSENNNFSRIYPLSLRTTSNAVGGYELFTFTFYTNNGATEQFGTYTIRINYVNETVAPTYSSYTATLGNATNGANQGVDLSTGTTYTVNASTTSANVDLVYGNGGATGNKYFLAAPSDQSAQAVYSDIVSWSTINETSLYTVSMTTTEFDAIDADSDITNVLNSGSLINSGADDRFKQENLSDFQGKVIGFITANNEKGLIKISSAGGSNSVAGTVGISIKVLPAAAVMASAL